MLEAKDIHEAIEVLIAYESAYVQDLQKNSDINEGLFWDKGKLCFSMDFGMCLRGEAEDVRIYRDAEDYMIHRCHSINQNITCVYYNGALYIIENLSE